MMFLGIYFIIYVYDKLESKCSKHARQGRSYDHHMKSKRMNYTLIVAATISNKYVEQ